MLKLSPRMKMAADMVRRGCVVCDVGTDHAYLPSYLVQSGVSPRALACDIGTGPLENARKSVEGYGLSAKIALRLSDGLDKVGEDEAEAFVFCGMGGTLMAQLLSRAQWLKNPSKQIVVQPMTHIDDVRRFFIENGFEIERESACFDAGHVYAAISARYSGEIREYAPGFIYYGRLAENGDEASACYIKKQLERLEKHKKGIENSPEAREEYAALVRVTQDITEVLKNAEGQGDF